MHSIHFIYDYISSGATCSSVVRAFVHDVMDRRIDPSTHTMAFLTPVKQHWLELDITELVHHEESI